MKKILFNDKFGLTDAVLKGRKTMTRRNVKCDMMSSRISHSIDRVKFANELLNGRQVYFAWDAAGNPIGQVVSTYHVGEEVAVAQSYKDCGYDPDTLQQVYVKEPTIFPDLDPISSHCGWVDLPFKCHKGWNNKMFVRADLMPHTIRVTGIKLERLQDISDEDCLREGIIQSCDGMDMYTFDGWFKRHKGGILPIYLYVKSPRVFRQTHYLFVLDGQELQHFIDDFRKYFLVFKNNLNNL